MYFKVDKTILKKALVYLKKQPKFVKELTYDHRTNKTTEKMVPNEILKYITQIEFALYKTKMEEFYIDFDFAQEIRPSLLTKKGVSK